MNKKSEVFKTLNAIDVTKYIDKKNGFTYLPWASAWKITKEYYPDASYSVSEVRESDTLGYMCHTHVTIEGETLSMWLPVMDGANKAMKSKPYTYKTRYGEKAVEAATMFDINKTIMRCLTKNIAMFGLGLYLYEGEDLPTDISKIDSTVPQAEVKTTSTKKSGGKLELKVSDKDFKKVAAYIADNKSLGLEGIVEKLSKRYNINESLKKEFKKLL